ncbi:hypothetical protein FA15DRAFT_671560 [Coprinopsis marcescibilis]|uniref:F-box domain-containing protein n=1 Tax=Coprinopsis marcescibilis TaxID=230819 RepID=A0A5C3KQM6_COPMA|nr:hypothetical protein FA15DRAFT_671560 [Coprinopsis marcescibilis]
MTEPLLSESLPDGTSSTPFPGPLSTSQSVVRFHSNPDILAYICEYLSYDQDFDSVEQYELEASRRNLAALALTCRAYLEPALDCRWRALDNLYPLFRILPAFVATPSKTHVLRGTISPEEWARFDWYARRVKRFCYSRDPNRLDIAMHVYFRIAQLRSTPLLPSLRHLHCPWISQSDFLISGVFLFLSPSLQSLEFCKITSIEDKLIGTFLHTLHADGADLESIVLRGENLTDGMLDLVLPFSNLRTLEIDGMGPAIELAWLQELGRKPKLEELALDFTNSNIEPLTEDIGFPNLKSLMITASIPFTRAFLPHITSTSLETLVAVSSQDTASQRTGFITDSVDRWGSCLQSFGLVHIIHGENLTISDELDLLTAIAPLLPLRNLREFRLEGYILNLTDENVVQLAMAWPRITKLLLPYVSGDRTRPTLNSLVNLRDLCPQLKHVRIPIDITDIPPFVLPKPPLSPPLFSPSPSSMEVDLNPTISSSSGHTAQRSIAAIPTPTVPLKSNSPLDRQHGLQRLTMATEDDQEHEDRFADARNLVQFARHVDHLFPRIQDITGLHHHDEERWAQLHEVVQAFQAVRAETLSACATGSNGWYRSWQQC